MGCVRPPPHPHPPIPPHPPFLALATDKKRGGSKNPFCTPCTHPGGWDRVGGWAGRRAPRTSEPLRSDDDSPTSPGDRVPMLAWIFEWLFSNRPKKSTSRGKTEILFFPRESSEATRCCFAFTSTTLLQMDGFEYNGICLFPTLPSKNQKSEYWLLRVDSDD